MITAAVCDSYKLELLLGAVHQAGDEYKIALYASSANLDKATTEYESAGEVSGIGYSAGGMDLDGFVAALSGESAYIKWTVDPVWPVATLTSRGALIYNASRSNKAVAVLDFEADISSTNAPFTVELPARVITLS